MSMTKMNVVEMDMVKKNHQKYLEEVSENLQKKPPKVFAPLKKTLNPGSVSISGSKQMGSVFLKIVISNTNKDGITYSCLSISGVVGPMHSGNCRGSGGQIIEDLKDPTFTLQKEWSQEMLNKLYDIWDKWHLNDINAGCIHQDSWDTGVKDINGKYLGHIDFENNPDGLLGKPCPECGYRYGHSWLYRELPEEVVSFLNELPSSEKTPAWVS